MHGYLPFDSEDNLLVPFRTWRNTITGEAAGMFPIDSKTRDYDAPVVVMETAGEGSPCATALWGLRPVVLAIFFKVFCVYIAQKMC